MLNLFYHLVRFYKFSIIFLRSGNFRNDNEIFDMEKVIDENKQGQV